VCSSGSALTDAEVASGVSSADGSCDAPARAAAETSSVSPSLERLRVGFATGVAAGRLGDELSASHPASEEE
jgi:hypothetical protein